MSYAYNKRRKNLKKAKIGDRKEVRANPDGTVKVGHIMYSHDILVDK